MECPEKFGPNPPPAQGLHATTPLAAQASVPLESNVLEIAERAYYLYLERDRHPGGDFDDWLRAERELREASHLS